MMVVHLRRGVKLITKSWSGYLKGRLVNIYLFYVENERHALNLENAFDGLVEEEIRVTPSSSLVLILVSFDCVGWSF